jgi:hypothetical protein
MEPAGAERHRRRSPRRLSSRERANQSNQGVGRKPRCPTKPSEILRRGRESNPRIAVLQTATLPLGYPADLRERTISLWRRLYQALSIERQVFAATTASASGQRFNASANPVIVSA